MYRPSCWDALDRESFPVERITLEAGAPVSIPFFVLLILTFWPAGLAYTW